MPGLAVRGTTYNLPNYHGSLQGVTPEDTPFLTALGGLQQGGDSVGATEFEWQFYDLRDAAQNTRLEGADAPAPNHRVRFARSNVLEIHQESVDVSYTVMAAINRRNGLNANQPNDPALSELNFQIVAQLKQIKRDIEYSFVRGAYVRPADNSSARQTRGIIAATETNVIAKVGAPDPTETDILDLMQMVYENGGISEQETATFIVGAALKRWLTKIFITDKGYSEDDRNVGGVRLTTIETDFGRVNVMLNRYMPGGTLQLASLEECEPMYLEIPGKGVFFVEPLAKTGASEKAQIYGEVGLKYGNERKHGKITGYTTAAPA